MKMTGSKEDGDMKKTIMAMAAIAAAFTMASCNKEQLAESEGTPVVGNDIITAYTESTLTKTSLDGDDTNGYDVVWSEGDKIKIGDNEFTLIEGSGTANGKFQGNLPTEDCTYTVYYPSTYDGSNWPASQTFVAGNIAGSPMKAEVTIADGEMPASIKFYNEGGILRISAKADDNVPAAIGIVSVTVNAAELAAPIILDCSAGASIDRGVATDFHIAMLPGIYTEVSIVLTASDGTTCTKTLIGKNLVIEKSVITPASFTASNFKSVVTVKFDLNNAGMIGNFNAKPVDLTDIDYNTTITEPNTLFAENYVFRGWYKEATCENAWDFANDKVVCNTTLYAKWASNPLDESEAAKISGKDYVKLAGFYWATENVLPSKKYWNYSPLYPDYYDHYDAQGAAESWAAGWTLPSSAQWQALLDNCICEWKTDYTYKGEAMKGLLVTGKEEYYEKGHSIFLPICSIYNQLDDLDESEISYYFRYLTNDDYYLTLESNSPCISSIGESFPAGSVRPVASL